MTAPVDVMILCAGLGTRLRPMTLERPKPAVPLMNRPMVGLTLEQVRRFGADRVVINTHWLPDVMREVAQTECRSLGVELAVSHEPVVLGTGGGLWQARARGLIGRDRHLLVLNGDVLSDVNLNALVETHLRTNAMATMVLRPMPAGESYTPIEADEAGRIRRIGKYGRAMGRAPLLFTGAHLLSPAALDLLPEGESGVIDQIYARLLQKDAHVQAMIDHGLWLDLGDPEGYLGAHLAVLRQEIPTGLLDRVGLRQPAIAAGAHVASTATIESSVVGEGAIVGERTQLTECVVWSGAHVPADVNWRRCIVTLNSMFQVRR